MKELAAILNKKIEVRGSPKIAQRERKERRPGDSRREANARSSDMVLWCVREICWKNEEKSGRRVSLRQFSLVRISLEIEDHGNGAIAA